MSAVELQKLMDLFQKRRFDGSASVESTRRHLDGISRLYQPPAEVSITGTTIAGLSAERHFAGEGPNVLYLHGGGYVTGSLLSHRHLAARIAADLKGTVHVIEYRMAPEAPFPAAIDDCLAAYKALSDRPLSIVGDSAGGGAAFATAMAARDCGLPLPQAVVGISPWVNLGTEAESYDLIASLDPLLSRDVATWHAERYLAGASASDARASPLFGNLAGLPPTLIQIGDREVFFTDAARMHMSLLSAGVDAELTIWKAMFHVWHMYWPDLEEGRLAISQVADFILRHHGH